VGVNVYPIGMDHAGDQVHRILTALNFQRPKAQVHVLFQFVTPDGKCNIGPLSDSVIGAGDFQFAFSLATHQFFPLRIRQQAEPETTAAPVRPAFELFDFITVLIVVNFSNIRVAGDFVKKAVAHTTDTTIAVHQHLGQNTDGVGTLFEPV